MSSSSSSSSSSIIIKENSYVVTCYTNTIVSTYSLTVLAWLKTHLSIYIDLNLVTPILPDLSNFQYWSGTPLLCLAHCFFPDAFDNNNLLNQLNGKSEFNAIALFKVRLHVLIQNNDMELYFKQIREAITEQKSMELTIRDLHIGSACNDTISQSTIDTIKQDMMRLYHQCATLLLTRPSSTTTTTWEDINRQFQQLNKTLDDIQHPDLNTCLSAIYATRAVLESQLHEGLQNSIHVETTLLPSNTRNELDFIHAKLARIVITDKSIRDLELRLSKMNAYKQDVNYKRVLSSVKDVRYWFTESRNVCVWAEKHLHQLETKQLTHDTPDFHYNDAQISTWNQELLDLQSQIDAFDVTKLRTHVRKLTLGPSMNPADASVIEIIYAALMTFDRLTYVLEHHSYEVRMITVRLAWEQSYHVAADWIRDTTKDVNDFIKHKTSWQPPPPVKSDMFATLTHFEQQLSEPHYMTATILHFRNVGDACHVELPAHMMDRQHTLIESYDELTQLVTFARQIVEQYAIVSDILQNANSLMAEGDKLLQDMKSATHLLDLNERVAAFQEKMVDLIMEGVSRVPYHPSLEGNETNEIIRAEISARKSALIVLGESIDQAITSLRRALQSQKRAKQLQLDIHRLKGWTHERLKSIEKSNIDALAVGICGLDLDDIARLKSESNGLSIKLNGIVKIELVKLKDNVQSLYQFPDESTALGVDIETLEGQMAVLGQAIHAHDAILDVLRTRIYWETQYAKATEWVSATTFDVWDFITRKAQWRTSALFDEARQDEQWDLLVKEEWETLWHNIQSFQDVQLASTNDAFHVLKQAIDLPLSKDSNLSALASHLQYRQSTLDHDYFSLVDLMSFAKQVMYQHSWLTRFTADAQSLQNQGEQLSIVVKEAINCIMTLSNYDEINETIKCFNDKVTQLWSDAGTQLPYPQCPASAYASRPSTNDDTISSEIAAAVFNMYSGLQDWIKRVSALQRRLESAMTYRIKIEQWCTETRYFMQIVSSCTADMSAYAFDLENHAVTHDKQDVALETCQEKESALTQQLDQYQVMYYDALNERGLALRTSCAADIDNNSTVNNTVVLERLWSNLDHLWSRLVSTLEHFKQKLSFCTAKRDWYCIWTTQHQDLTQFQNNMATWDGQKSLWISTYDCENTEQGKRDLCLLVNECEKLNQTFNSYMDLNRTNLFAAHNELASVFDSMSTKEDPAILCVSQQNAMQDMYSDLQESMACRLAEIYSLQKRYEWESLADRQIAECKAHQADIERYIDTCARWSPSSAPVDDTCKSLNKLHTSTTHFITTSKNLNNNDRLLPLSDHRHPSVLSRKICLDALTESMTQQGVFVDKLVSQHKEMCALVQSFDEMESTAKALESKITAATASDLPTVALDLETFNHNASTLYNNDVGCKMTYPVRNDEQADVTHNNLIKTVVEARQARLVEIQALLAATLNVKERDVAREAIMQVYSTEVANAQAWIDHQLLQLDQYTQQHSLVDAIGLVGDLKAAIRTSALVAELNVTADKCIAKLLQQQQQQQQQAEECNDKVAACVQQIEANQLHLTQVWQDLSKKVLGAEQDLCLQQKRADFVALAAAFKDRCDNLQISINTTDVDKITDGLALQWQADVRALTSDALENIKHTMDETWQTEYDTLVAQSRKVGVQLHDRLEKANQHKLKTAFYENADALERLIHDIDNTLQFISIEACVVKGDVEDDMARLESAGSSFSDACKKMDQGQVIFDKHKDVYSRLELVEAPDPQSLNARQQELQLQWEKLQSKRSLKKQHVIDPATLWVEFHQKINSLKEDSLDVIADRLHHFKPDDVMPDFLTEDSEALGSIEQHAAEYLNAVKQLPLQQPNMQFFQEKYNSLLDSVMAAKNLLENQKRRVQEKIEYKSLQAFVNSICEKMDIYVGRIASDKTAMLADVVDVGQLYNTFLKSYEQRKSEQDDIRKEIEQLQQCIDKYVQAYGDRGLLEQLDEARNKLDGALIESEAMNDILKRTLEYRNVANDINVWFDRYQRDTEKVIEKANSHSDESKWLSELDQELALFETTIQSFQVFAENLTNTPVNNLGTEMQGVFQNNIIDNTVTLAMGNIRNKWESAHENLSSARKAVECLDRLLLILDEIRSLNGMVDETRCYVEELAAFDDSSREGSISDDDDKTQIGEDEKNTSADSDKDSASNKVTVADKMDDVVDTESLEKSSKSRLTSMPRRPQVEEWQSSMDYVESEVQLQIDQRLEKLQVLMTDIADENADQQYKELRGLVLALKDLYRCKKDKLETAMVIGSYLSLTDSIETLQTSIEEAIHEITSRFNEPLTRTGLHAVVIELDARFKYYERRISPALQEATAKASEAQQRMPKNDTSVKDHLDGILKRWDCIKKQFKARKIDLSRSIDITADSQDQQTRFRKSSLPTRKVSNSTLLHDLAVDPNKLKVSPTTSTASSSSFSSKSSKSKLIHQVSKSTTESKPSPKNNAPFIIKTPLPNSYVPDPKNDLDVEISRIVNEIPYKVEVRMAPGGPGRYWFGKINPKLCYCRILKSKMVMVRVGGGWTELTQFLKNHTLLEGEFVPRIPHKTSATFKKKGTMMLGKDNDEPFSPVIKDGFIETHQAIVVDLSRNPPQEHESHALSETSYQEEELNTNRNRDSKLGYSNDHASSRIAKRIEKKMMNL